MNKLIGVVLVAFSVFFKIGIDGAFLGLLLHFSSITLYVVRFTFGRIAQGLGNRTTNNYLIPAWYVLKETYNAERITYNYFAYATDLVSLITVTLICPG